MFLFSTGSSPPLRPDRQLCFPAPFSLFCLLLRLVFHLRGAPFRCENKHRAAGWQGDQRHEGTEQPVPPSAPSGRVPRARPGEASGASGLAGERALGGGGAGGPSPVRVLRVRSSPRREADNSSSGSLGSLTPRWARLGSGKSCIPNPPISGLERG